MNNFKLRVGTVVWEVNFSLIRVSHFKSFVPSIFGTRTIFTSFLPYNDRKIVCIYYTSPDLSRLFDSLHSNQLLRISKKSNPMKKNVLKRRWNPSEFQHSSDSSANQIPKNRSSFPIGKHSRSIYYKPYSVQLSRSLLTFPVFFFFSFLFFKIKKGKLRLARINV